MNSSSTSETAPTRLTFLLAIAVGITAANLYYAQPLVAMIAKAIGLSPGGAGLVVTLTQIGYGLGVLFLVPLGDIVENRRLILTMIFMTVFGLLGLTFSTTMLPYFLAAFLTGLGASTVQMIVPYAAHLVSEENRGRIVGNLMSGLMIGIMMSRPISGFLTDLFSWHAVFVMSSVLMALLGLTLYALLPARKPHSQNVHYFALMKSMGQIFFNTPILRRKAIYQAFVFGAFCLFWTASPLLLASPEFHFSQTQIALFALVGVSGAISAPFAGRAADRGWGQPATAISLIAASGSFLLTHFFELGSTASVVALAFSAILLDAGVSANLVLGQRAIFTLMPEFRSRLNALYIATIFIGGATGSAVGAWAFSKGGWLQTSWVGFLMPAFAFLYFLTERWAFRSSSAVSTRAK